MLAYDNESCETVKQILHVVNESAEYLTGIIHKKVAHKYQKNDNGTIQLSYSTVSSKKGQSANKMLLF